MSLACKHKQCHTSDKWEIKHFISSFFMHILFFFTALALRCYECPSDLTNLSSANTCSNPTDIIECTDPSHDSCLSVNVTGLTGNASDFGEFTFHSLNCTTKLLCDEAMKNLTCDLLDKQANAPAFKLQNCEISCCQGDLCNKPLEGPTDWWFARDVTPQDVTSFKTSVCSTTFSLNCALFCILGLIPLAVMNIF